MSAIQLLFVLLAATAFANGYENPSLELGNSNVVWAGSAFDKANEIPSIQLRNSTTAASRGSLHCPM